MGRGGLSYRRTLAGGPNRCPSTSPPRQQLAPGFSPSPELIDALPIVTVLEMDYSDPTDLVDDLNAAARRIPFWPPTWLKGLHRVPVMYDINDTPAQAFDMLVQAFHGVRASNRRWLIDAQGALITAHQRKVNAGATSLVNRQPAGTVVEGPKWLMTNIVVPGLQTKSFSLYFLPDQVLVQTGKRMAAWRYRDIDLSFSRTRFIEEETVPRDAQQVDQTWKYVNKSGGPDKRYNNNRVLPIMEYAELEVAGTGLALRWQISNVVAAHAFAERLSKMQTIPIEREASDSQPTMEPQAPLSARPTYQPAVPSSPTLPSPPAQPGWLPDPMHTATWRWWDGQTWTEHTA